MVGWCRFKFTGDSGFGTYIRHAEVLVQSVVTNKSEIYIYMIIFHIIFKLI